MSATALPPLGIYVHFPWCVAKCPYCDFNSHTLRGDLPDARYVDALLADLDRAATGIVRRKAGSVFLGGGTPSLFPPEQLARLLDALRDLELLDPAAEITLEANPGAIEHSAFAAYRDAGINRLSLGVQSLSDAKLQRLGRIHNSQDVRNAYSEARAAGFDNINLDLMYALPEQSLQEAVDDVCGVLELAPEHVSHYQLTLEPNTVFYARPPKLPDTDLAWDIQTACATELRAAGFENYEVSAWALPARRSIHNTNYWLYGDYIGIGAGAHAKMSSLNGPICREVRVAHPREYLAIIERGENPAQVSEVPRGELVFEFVLNALRLKDGFRTEHFEMTTGLPAIALEDGLKQARALQLIAESGDGRIAASEKGWRFLNDLQMLFLTGARD